MKSPHNQKSLKAQDVLVLLKLLTFENKDWGYEDLHEETGLSLSECHSAIQRLLASKLVRREFQKIRVNRQATKEFLFYGLPYVFPAKVRERSSGFPVAHSGPLLSKMFVYDPKSNYVWQDPEGETEGSCILPLYKTVPYAIKKDPKLYELLSLVEALRVGRAREVTAARKYLEERMQA